MERPWFQILALVLFFWGGWQNPETDMRPQHCLPIRILLNRERKECHCIPLLEIITIDPIFSIWLHTITYLEIIGPFFYTGTYMSNVDHPSPRTMTYIYGPCCLLSNVYHCTVHHVTGYYPNNDNKITNMVWQRTECMCGGPAGCCT